MSRRRKNRLRRLFFKTLFITMAILIALMLAAYGVFAYLLGGLNRTTLDESKLSVTAGLGWTPETMTTKVVPMPLWWLLSMGKQGRSNWFPLPVILM